MNFFEHQEQARKKTNQLVILFILGILGVIFTIYFSFILLVYFKSKSTIALGWEPRLFFPIAILTILTIGCGSLRKISQLRQGGEMVAVELGGRVLEPERNDLEKRLYHVVAEVAIASGVPVPKIFLLENETGINAFAAGLSTDTAVIGVTKGCLEQLDRDELQGVIAHEFSHILNGDMRLNIQLMGVLHGLLFIYMMGQFLVRSLRYRSFRNGNLSMLMMIGGFILMICGSVGLLFGRIIQSSISRQREFLADSSAVQFTRNKEGIASALYKIHKSSFQSFVAIPAAEGASHMFFGDAIQKTVKLTNLLDTHPPIPERLRRLGVSTRVLAKRNRPQRQGVQSSLSRQPADEMADVQGARVGSQGAMGFSAVERASSAQASQSAVSAKSVLEKIGTVGEQQLSFSQTLVQQIPDSLINEMSTPEGSMGLLFALLIQASGQPDESTHRAENLLSTQQFQRVQSFLAGLEGYDPKYMLPLVDWVIPALRNQPSAQLDALQSKMLRFRPSTQEMNIRAYALQIILKTRLNAYSNPASETKAVFTTVEQIWTDAITVLSALAIAGQDQSDDQLLVLRDGLSHLGKSNRSLPTAVEPLNWQQLESSLIGLSQAVPKLKQKIVNACTYTALVDGVVIQA